QTVVVGVGNIYASESLFLAGVRPTRITARVRREEWREWIRAIREILQQSIRKGGTTLRDYRSLEGEGGFQKLLYVYDRHGANCRRCESRIKVKVIGGRSTFWCAVC